VSEHQGPVGVIGLGQMGGAMCRTLLRAGWDVVAWDLFRAAVDAAAEAGARPAADPAEVAAHACVIITSLPDVEAVRAVTLGDRGIVQAPDVRGVVVVDTSTLLPDDARLLAADLIPFGVGLLDAPVSGGVRGASTGQLAFMVGGRAEDFEIARPVLSSLAKAAVHCGPSGAGQITKACNQLVVMATHASIAESLVLAQAAGLDPWRVREALMAGYAQGPILEIQGPRMLNHEFEPGGRARFHAKDIAAIRQLVGKGALDLPVFQAASRQFERLFAAGGADLDNSAVVTVVETRSGRDAPAPADEGVRDWFDLTGRVALVTGAGQGVGFALARGLARAGATPVLNDCNEAQLERALEELRSQGIAAHGEVFDVTDPEQVQAGVAAVEHRVGQIDVLVNNAGNQHRQPLEDVSLEDWQRVIDLMVTGPFLVGQAVARGMIERGHGKIINISSVFSEFARPSIAPYTAAKGAVKNLTKGMCADWARYGIQANAIGPGYYVTPLTQPLRDDEAFDAWLRTRVPAGRWGNLDELVGAAVFLSSRASDFVNGQILFVDGGLTAVI
jgi:gluconate 5-dehydrogenase